MSKLNEIQTDLAAARLERARLRRSLVLIEERIGDLEQSQDLMEQAIAVVGASTEPARVSSDSTVRRLAGER